jgi:hypothetical protein
MLGMAELMMGLVGIYEWEFWTGDTDANGKARNSDPSTGD